MEKFLTNEKNKILKSTNNENIKILNQPLQEYFPLKTKENIQKKETSDRTLMNSLTISIKDNLGISKNNSLLPTIDKKLMIYPQLPTEHSNSKTHKSDGKKRNEKNIIVQKKVENTKKIDYRFYKNYPLKKIFPFLLNPKEEEYYWLATYDKLFKKKKLFKIFSFYNIASRASIALGNEGIYNDFSKIKEKKLKLKNYELYFIEKHNKPFIRKCEDKYIYVKLYLLTLKQINMIFSYLNRIEFKEYINNLNNLYQKDSYKKIDYIENNNENKHINYSAIYYLGTYMNIKIFGFSRIENEDDIKDNYNIGVDNYPNSKKIAKLIKLLMINFPEYTKEHFINYIFNDSHNNGLNKKMLADKKNEINHLLISKKKSIYKANSKNGSIMQSIVSGIPEFSFSPYFSSNTYNKNVNTNHNFKIINSNTNNNINKLGTISYNASCFDFTSDFFNSLRQNDETMSKAIDSIRSISNQNARMKNLFNNYNSNKNKRIGQEAKISNFSFENDSNNTPYYIKIDVSNRNNQKEESKNHYIKKETLKNFENYKLPSKQFIKIKLKKKIIVNKNSVLNELSSNKAKFSKKNNCLSGISQSILEDNKENYNNTSNYNIKDSYNNDKSNKLVSDFTIIKVQKFLNKNKLKKSFNKKKVFINNSSSNNRTFLKGEDIFKTTNTRNSKRISEFYRYYLSNGVRSSDYKNIRKMPIFKMSNNFTNSSQTNKNMKI